MDQNSTQPVLLDIEQISGGWIKKYLLKYRLPNGDLFNYESISRKSLEDYKVELQHTQPPHTDAVSIVALTENNELLMVKEFRYPVNSWIVAFPAGLLEAGEDLASGVERELREETGYGLIEGKPVRKLPQPGYSSTGMSEESVQIVFAHVKKVGKPHPESMEFIEPFTLPLDQVDSFLETNTIPIGTRAQLTLELFTTRSYF